MKPLLLPVLMISHAHLAFADDYSVRVQLPHCPSELKLNIPKALSGLVNSDAEVDHLNSNPARKGRYVASLRNSAGDLLQVMELGTTSNNQGRFKVSSLDALEAEARKALKSMPPEAKGYRDALMKGAKLDGLHSLNVSLFDVWRKESAVVVVAIVTFKLEDQPETKLLASQMFEVSRDCLATVTYYVPLNTNRAYTDIQQVVREINFR